MDHNHLQLAIELRHSLHAHPELSYQETWTKETLMSFLKAHTKLEIHDRGKYFYAVYRKKTCSGKARKGSKGSEKNGAIAFRADIDGLPIEDKIDRPYRSEFAGRGHKCGHDGHAATLCAFGLEVDQLQPDRDVYLIFQHAEETGQGAIEAKECLVENPDITEIYAYHNQVEKETGHILVCEGSSNCASKGMNIQMMGAPTHASLPEKGRNPIFALANVVRKISTIADPKRYQGLILCTVVQLDAGEYAFGVAADRGVLRLTIRGEYEEELNRIQVELMETAQREAEKYGVTCAFSFEDEFPETRNDTECAKKVEEAAKRLGLPCTIGRRPSRGSEDFGHFLKVKPGALFFIGNGDQCPSFHTVDYDFNDEVIEYGVEMFKMLTQM